MWKRAFDVGKWGNQKHRALFRRCAQDILSVWGKMCCVLWNTLISAMTGNAQPNREKFWVWVRWNLKLFIESNFIIAHHFYRRASVSVETAGIGDSTWVIICLRDPWILNGSSLRAGTHIQFLPATANNQNLKAMHIRGHKWSEQTNGPSDRHIVYFHALQRLLHMQHRELWSVF